MIAFRFGHNAGKAVAAPAAAAAAPPKHKKEKGDPKKGQSLGSMFGPARFTDTTIDSSALQKGAESVASKQAVPHLFLDIDVRVDALVSLLENAEGSGTTLSDCVVRAAALALADTPEANAVFDPTTGMRGEPLEGENVGVTQQTAGGAELLAVVSGGARSSVSAIAAQRAAGVSSGAVALSVLFSGAGEDAGAGVECGAFRTVVATGQSLALSHTCISALMVPGDGEGAAPVLGHVARVSLAVDGRVLDAFGAAEFLQKVGKNLATVA